MPPFEHSAAATAMLKCDRVYGWSEREKVSKLTRTRGKQAPRGLWSLSHSPVVKVSKVTPNVVADFCKIETVRGWRADMQIG
jgi:hypothetical protein